MACHYLTFDTSADFFKALKQRDSDLILKMVKCVLSAEKRKKESIDIFEMTFKNLDSLTFTVAKDQYQELLNNCLEDLIKIEEYELCAEITKILNKRKVKEIKEK